MSLSAPLAKQLQDHLPTVLLNYFYLMLPVPSQSFPKPVAQGVKPFVTGGYGAGSSLKSNLVPLSSGSPSRLGPQPGLTLPVKPSPGTRVFGPRNIPIITPEDEEEAKQFQEHLSDGSFFTSATDEATAAESEGQHHSSTSQTSPKESARRLRASSTKYDLSLEGSAIKKPRAADPPLFMRGAYPKDRIQAVVSHKLQEPVPVDNSRVMLNDNPALTCSALFCCLIRNATSLWWRYRRG
jgi:hypothetical protein